MTYVKIAFVEGTHYSFRDSWARIVMVDGNDIITIPMWNSANSSDSSSMFSAMIRSVFNAWGNGKEDRYDKSNRVGKVVRIRKDTGIHKLMKSIHEYETFDNIRYSRSTFKEFVNFVAKKSGKKLPMNSRGRVEKMSRRKLMEVIDAMAEHCDEYITLEALDKVV